MDDISQDLRRDMESARLGQYFNEMLQRLDKLGQEDPVLYMFLWMLIGLRSQVDEMAQDFYRKNITTNQVENPNKWNDALIAPKVSLKQSDFFTRDWKPRGRMKFWSTQFGIDHIFEIVIIPDDYKNVHVWVLTPELSIYCGNAQRREDNRWHYGSDRYAYHKYIHHAIKYLIMNIHSREQFKHFWPEKHETTQDNPETDLESGVAQD